MSKELEAVNRIKDDIEIGYLPIQNAKDKELYLELLKTIKTSLKENKKLKKLYKAELKNTAYYNNLALKYKKALEVIKSDILDDLTFNDERQEITLEWGTIRPSVRIKGRERYEFLKEILK